MARIQWSRVVLGGLAAGVVINICEYLLNGLLLARSWAEALRALNRPAEFTIPEIFAFNVWGFLMGFAAVWLYASIRDHYGAGWRTAIWAGLGVWAIGYLFGAIPSAAMHLFPRVLLIYGVSTGLAEVVIGTVVGAWLYRPNETTRAVAA